MDDLDGCSEKGCMAGSADGAMRCEDEHPTKSFAASGKRVPNRFSNVRWNIVELILPNRGDRRFYGRAIAGMLREEEVSR